jgi:hypothetical protein
MPNLKTLTGLSLVLTSLMACGDAPPCPVGTDKQHGECVDVGNVGEGDAGADAGLDGGPCTEGALVYLDSDGDGVGAGAAVEGCPAGDYVAKNGDCAPENAKIFPGSFEICNSLDDNCNGKIDEGVSVTLYVDADGDGHGSQSDAGETVCMGQSRPGKVLSHDDCDDSCETCSPDNPVETTCDGKDDDCDTVADDGVDAVYFLDCDGDKYLPAPEQVQMSSACQAPAPPKECPTGTWLLQSEPSSGVDCNPAEASIHPNAEEACDNIDNDCDGMIDDENDVEKGLWVKFSLDCDGDFHIAAMPLVRTQCPELPLPSPMGSCPSGAGLDRHPRWLRPEQAEVSVDCADSDADAYAGSEHADSEHVAGHGADDFDYDCDGHSTTIEHVCSALESCGTVGTKVCFKTSIPECGESGPSKTLSVVLGSCSISEGQAEARCH